jgi:hypothetical protein
MLVRFPWFAVHLTIQWNLCGHLAIFQPEEYVTSSVLTQGVFDSPSLTLVIGANIFEQILNIVLR